MAHASFGTLPLELKARVVEMVADQEDAWRVRVKDIKKRVGHINCLSALALGNKELRDLAAKHQFKTLSSGKASRPVFRFTILRQYGHHITRVKLRGTKEGHLDDALAIMSQLPSLCTLSFTHEAAIALFGPAVAVLPSASLGSDAAQHRAGMLAHVSSQITTLTLRSFTPSTSVDLVQLFPNLTTLYLRKLGAAANEGDVKRLAESIATRHHLKSLAIDLADGTEAGWPTEAFGALERDPPPLHTLQLVGFPLDHHTLNLISPFGCTLETMSLQLRGGLESDLSSRDQLHLPRLTSLSLTLSKRLEDVQDVIRIIAAGPSLSSLSLGRSSTGIMDPTKPALVAALDAQPVIRRVQLGESVRKYPLSTCTPIKDLATPSSLAAYADLVRSRNLDPSVLDRPHLTPFHPDANLDYTENEGAYLAEVLDRTLDFGRSELKRMVAEGRAASAVEWVEALKPLEDKRLAWKD